MLRDNTYFHSVHAGHVALCGRQRVLVTPRRDGQASPRRDVASAAVALGRNTSVGSLYFARTTRFPFVRFDIFSQIARERISRRGEEKISLLNFARIL